MLVVEDFNRILYSIIAKAKMRSLYTFLLVSISISLVLAGTMPPNGGRLSMLDYYVRFIVDRDGDSRITI